jgi:lysophospholipase L1-like esterase
MDARWQPLSLRRILPDALLPPTRCRQTTPMRLLAMKTSICVFATLLLLFGVPRSTAQAEELRLTLPPKTYATPGVPISIYHDNIVLTQHPEEYRFEFTCQLGKSDDRRWSVTAADGEVGQYGLTVVVKDKSGKVLEQASTVLQVSPSDAGAARQSPLRLLIVGDSLTNATLYPNEIARLLSQPGNPKWTLLGTHKPASAQPGVAHEGYGGWKWSDFLTRFAPDMPTKSSGRKATSPFIFPAADGNSGQFDLPRYFRQHCDNRPPDVVMFLLGINDCFAANPDDPDPKISEVLEQAEKLLAEFHKAAPQAVLAVGLTTPPNARQEAFEANYQDRYTRWGWKRIQHRLVERMLKQLAGREKDGIYLAPTELNLDPIGGYPVNNGVHPNAEGYAQIGASFYCWLKAALSAGAVSE